ncbi:Lar-like restriction alleviation protein [Flavonifractor phage Chenonceau]|uniref:BC1881 family protein n=1 Tax=Flavonifractor plautii TaxID=292800 RepID=A0AAX1KGC1_FLAPL|nr:BC1881 family protein [Flavonifractor plautii]QQR04900.1 BC1881 family protein [Flavonifractor plautii]UQA25700.1 BC1881 family protein [Flavonifractor plautii]WAK79775.1 Lar-like restriction alleviation protein [Flavonifractor phage Chenonceau]
MDLKDLIADVNVNEIYEHIETETLSDWVNAWQEAALAALRPVSRKQLSEFKTCDLVDELRKREGVETHIAEPYQDVVVSVNGPAVVLVVID